MDSNETALYNKEPLLYGKYTKGTIKDENIVVDVGEMRVLAQDDTDGKYIELAATNITGSTLGTPAGILLKTVDATTGDVEESVYVGGILCQDNLVFKNSLTLDDSRIAEQGNITIRQYLRNMGFEFSSEVNPERDFRE